MGSRERREREKSDVRELILDAARRLFVQEGYEAVSMRKIAGVIEYSPTAIYVHFKDKAALFKELCMADFQKLAVKFAKLAGIKDPIARIRRTGLEYIRFGIEHPKHYRLMFMTPVTGPDRQTMDEFARTDPNRGNPERDAYAFLMQAVREALAAGRFRGDLRNAHLLAQVFWAAVHGVASLEITHKDDPWIDWASIEKRSTVTIDATIRGLTHDAKRGGK